MPLCRSCNELTADRLQAAFKHPRWLDRQIEIQPSLKALRHSAMSCSLCVLFLHALESASKERSRNLFEGEAITLGSAVNNDHAGDIKSENEHVPPRCPIQRLALIAGRNKDFAVELLTSADPDDPVALSKDVTGRHVDLDPLSPGNIGYFSTLIEDCRLNHPCCNDTGHDNDYLPSRILDLGRGEPLQEIVLVDGIHHTGPYAALSHCWGNKPLLKTTRESLADHQSGILPETLPQTFRDAVSIVRALKVRYLWIDSLCIVQDDISDWQRESATMVDVYGRAKVVIAASAAKNGAQGCFASRTIPAPMTVHLPHFSGADKSPSSVRINYCQRRSYKSEIEVCSLQGRGWCMQELLLANRVLHFGKTQTFFECREWLLGEDDRTPKQYGLKRNLDISQAIESYRYGAENLQQGLLHERWSSILEQYSRRKLTKHTDKLPALQGIAEKISRETGKQYLAGLWKEDLHASLLWHRGYHLIPPAPTYRAPSWSWASRDGDILCGLDVRRFFRHTTSQMEFLDYQEILDSSTDGTISVHKSFLSLKCALHPVWYAYEPEHNQNADLCTNEIIEDDAPHEREAWQGLEIREDNETGWQFEFYLHGEYVGYYEADSPEDVPYGTESVCALLASCDPPHIESTIGIMVLVPVAGTDNHYMRAGVGQLTAVHLFQDREHQKITLI